MFDSEGMTAIPRDAHARVRVARGASIKKNAEGGLIFGDSLALRDVPVKLEVHWQPTEFCQAKFYINAMAHGLIRSSFVPPAPIQELRDLTRIRKQPLREISGAQLANPEDAGRCESEARQRALECLGLERPGHPERLDRPTARCVAFRGLAQGAARKKHAALIEALHGRHH